MNQGSEWAPVSHDTCDQVTVPFYHSTRADLAVGELLSAGFRSNCPQAAPAAGFIPCEAFTAQPGMTTRS